MTTLKEVADVLERAADLIEPEGAWTQGTWARDRSGDTATRAEEGCWCLWGAIYKTVGYDAVATSPCLMAVANLVGDSSIHWNDVPGRTQAEVVSALREAAKKARGGAE